MDTPDSNAIDRYLAQSYLDGFELQTFTFRDRALRAMLMREEDDVWFVQCVEHDLATQGDTRHDAVTMLIDLLADHEDCGDLFPGGLDGVGPPPAWVTERLHRGALRSGTHPS